MRLNFRDVGLRRILALAPLILVGQAVGNANVVVDRLVGSMQVEGTISALNYGFRLITLPHGLIALALVQVAYPALGAAGAEDDRPAFRELLRRGLGTLGLLLLPIAAAAVVLREPVVALVYQRGSFDAEDLSLTADAVAFYSLGLVFLAWRELIARAFYSHGDARTPMVVALVAMAVNVAGDLTLGRAYGVAGLAGSTSLSFAVALVLLAVALERRFGSLHAGALARLGMRLTISAAAAAAPMWLALEALREAGVTSELLLVLVPAVLGGAAYVTVTRWLAPREVRELARAIRSITRR